MKNNFGIHMPVFKGSKQEGFTMESTNPKHLNSFGVCVVVGSLCSTKEAAKASYKKALFYHNKQKAKALVIAEMEAFNEQRYENEIE